MRLENVGGCTKLCVEFDDFCVHYSIYLISPMLYNSIIDGLCLKSNYV